jgi:CelD/BcsL family acetyltransferase involved in cellulose biosynthesis
MQKIIRLSSLKDILELKEAWEELLVSSKEDRLFLSWDWVFTWCKHRSTAHDRFLLVVKERDQLVAIAPFVICKPNFRRLKFFRSINFMGTDVIGSDYMDILVRNGREQEAIKAIASFLATNRLSLELSHIGPDSLNSRLLVAELEDGGWNIVRREIEVCPYIGLAGRSWDSYLDTLGSSHRANIRRKMRKVYKQFTVEFALVGNGVSLGSGFDEMLNLHYARHGDASVSDAFNAESVLMFHKEIANRSLKRERLRLYIMKLDDIPVAALYGFLVDKKFYFYQSGFDPNYERYSVGMLLLAHTIEEAIREGADEYDFLHGNESYKFLWTKDSRSLKRLYAFAPALSGIIARLSLRIKQLSKGYALGLINS